MQRTFQAEDKPTRFTRQASLHTTLVGRAHNWWERTVCNIEYSMQSEPCSNCQYLACNTFGVMLRNSRKLKLARGVKIVGVLNVAHATANKLNQLGLVIDHESSSLWRGGDWTDASFQDGTVTDKPNLCKTPIGQLALCMASCLVC